MIKNYIFLSYLFKNIMLNDSIDLRCQSISILDKKKIDVNNFDEESKSGYFYTIFKINFNK